MKPLPAAKDVFVVTGPQEAVRSFALTVQRNGLAYWLYERAKDTIVIAPKIPDSRMVALEEVRRLTVEAAKAYLARWREKTRAALEKDMRAAGADADSIEAEKKALDAGYAELQRRLTASLTLL